MRCAAGWGRKGKVQIAGLPPAIKCQFKSRSLASDEIFQFDCGFKLVDLKCVLKLDRTLPLITAVIIFTNHTQQILIYI